MKHIDVCNGDADGLCAVRQWRLHEPESAALIAGLKRDIELLQRVTARPGDEVNVFDLSMRRNRAALQSLLRQGVHVRYFDHHASGPMPQHRMLEAHIDCSANACTSLLVDRYLKGRFRTWAIVGAYGDNLIDIANQLCHQLGLSLAAQTGLRRLGEAINYNAYGDDVRDVYQDPERLYTILERYTDPFDVIEHEDFIRAIESIQQTDMALAQQHPPVWRNEHGAIYLLPNTSWARRVMGAFANTLANQQPDQAHAILKLQAHHDYVASVRSPLEQPAGADELCRRFGGSGRAQAAGIDHLPAYVLDHFTTAFSNMQWGNPQPGRRPS